MGPCFYIIHPLLRFQPIRYSAFIPSYIICYLKYKGVNESDEYFVALWHCLVAVRYWSKLSFLFDNFGDSFHLLYAWVVSRGTSFPTLCGCHRVFLVVESKVDHVLEASDVSRLPWGIATTPQNTHHFRSPPCTISNSTFYTVATIFPISGDKRSH
jgi:hypothetical protein